MWGSRGHRQGTKSLINFPIVPSHLKRYQQNGDLHFLTFSCYHRLPYLSSDQAITVFLHSLEATRVKYEFAVAG